MRLQLNRIRIRDIQFGDSTSISRGVLSVSRRELESLCLQDERLSTVEIELARPGERARILHVLDVMEPRAKIGEGEADFLGIIGKQGSAGEGITCVLEGAAVVITDYRESRDLSTSSDPNGEIIDMVGPAAEISPYGKTHNVVLLCTPSEGVHTNQYRAALKVAGLRASVYLASAGKEIAPDEVEVFELPPLTEVRTGPVHLPRIVYIFQILTHQFEPVVGDPVLYGSNVADMLPTLIHPNEIFDGAITSALPGLNMQTYQIQNHPIIKELYRRHGKQVCFAGVIIMTAPNNVSDLERVSGLAAGLAKHVVGADGVLLTKTGGGAPELTMARTAQRCEQLGIKTAIAMLHMGADISDAKYGAVTIFSMPEVDALVSMGVPFMDLVLPSVDRIIGRSGNPADSPSVKGELVRAIRWIKGSQCQLGSSRLRAVRY